VTLPDSAIQDLSGAWTLSDETGEFSCSMAVPGDGVTALHQAHLIPDPYWGRNELKLRWIAERDWTLRRWIELSDPRVVLAIDGLDTVATVRVNGTVVLETANAFRIWRVDLSDVARPGRNEVAVTIHSAPREAAARAAAQPFPVPYIAQNNPIPHGNMLRKPACDWGWDWNIALVPFGITGGIWLERAEAPRIERIAIAQEHGEGTVAVTITAWAENADGQPFRIVFAGQTAEGILEDGGVAVIFDVENPSLWWPAGLGPQSLYDLEVRVGSDVAHRRIGLRRLELAAEPDAAGLSFGLRVNGHPVFARGANWIPTDALAGRITEQATRDLLQSAVAANMNTIRVWGGGRYEPDSFYDACDELGLMVWQDFMFSCNLYPSTPDFLEEVGAEVRENVARLHHHACLALWCGDNELIGALNWFEESKKDRDRYLVSYDRLNRTIETALKETDPTANWWPSSPSPGPLNFRDAWHEDGSGDMHFWSVWHEGRDFDHYRDVKPRFCSEFGFQSYPSMDVIRKFTGPEDWNIASPVFESHQKNAGGNARIAETMFRYFRWPERFEDFVWLSQLQQGLAIKTAVTAWRALKPHCQGTLYWQLNDTWPVCSWSSLDHGGGWKLLHHMARDFFRPVTVVAAPDADGIALVGVNDTLHPVEVTVTAYATQLSGASRELGKGRGTLGPEAQPLLVIDPAALAEQEVLTFGWEASDGSKAGDIFAPRPWKCYDLPDPGLAHQAAREGNRWVLSVTARAMAFFTTAEADLPGRWDRNAVHLGPGHTARLSFTPEDPGKTPRFLLRDLFSATTRRPASRTP
jgi:beta-mannosidase